MPKPRRHTASQPGKGVQGGTVTNRDAQEQWRERAGVHWEETGRSTPQQQQQQQRPLSQQNWRRAQEVHVQEGSAKYTLLLPPAPTSNRHTFRGCWSLLRPAHREAPAWGPGLGKGAPGPGQGCKLRPDARPPVWGRVLLHSDLPSTHPCESR